MANIKEFYTLVEDAIAQLGVDPNNCRDDEENGAWALMRGNQEIWVDCWYVEDEDKIFFQVLAPVFEVPENMTVEFYRELLETNYSLFGVSFGIYKNMLALKAIRDANGMDVEEALSIISNVGAYASEQTPALSIKYLGVDPNIGENN